MTKREICKRLLLMHARAVRKRDVSEICDLICDLLIDLAAPDDHFADAGKKEPPPGVIAKPGKDGGIEWCWCQKCYGSADVVHDPFGDGEDWSYCKKCGVSFRLKRKEEGK